MEILNTIYDVLEQLDDDHEVVIETRYGVRNDTVLDETTPEKHLSDGATQTLEFSFGPPENCKVIKESGDGAKLYRIDNGGALTRGRDITTFVDVTTGTWAGENEELADRIEA